LTVRQWLLLLATASSFASSAVLNKYLVGLLPPFTLAAMRVLLAAPVAFSVLLLMDRDLPRPGRDSRTVFLAALGVIVVPYCALAVGQQSIASGLSAILYSTMPLFTLLIAHFVLHDERIGLRKLLGIGLGFAGVAAIIGPSMLGGLGEHLIAELITLLGPLAYASGMVLMRRSRHIDPIGLTAGMFLFAVLVLLPVALLIEQPWTLRTPWNTLGWLFTLAMFGTILPALLNYLLVQRVGATRASIGMFLVPMIAVLLGAVFLDERLPLSAFVGMGFILAGSMIVNGFGGDWLRRFFPARAASPG
jgi:drug/metabolite transporter (DMT)-like permease